MPKPRKVYAMQNFLGLDKENKALKVAPFRASDGYNFQIDSNTLKTREGFVIDEAIDYDLSTTDSILDYYKYGDATFFVTKETFVVLYNGVTYNLKSTALTNVITSGLDALDNTNKKPIFREEKNALFIFGLDAIFVFTILFDAEGALENFVIYDLPNKPITPYEDEDEVAGTPADFNFQNYEDLPTPYEPTLYIGDTPFEDVNLLSNVSKYRLFANQETEDGYVKYILPTHFDSSKHGSVEEVENNVDIVFYNNTYGEPQIFPVFLGIDGENFDYDEVTHGSELNASINIQIEDTFYPTLEFESFKDYTQSPPVVGDSITSIVGLTKQDFFKSRIQGTSQTVFGYLLDLIEQNLYILSNKVVKFTLPIEYTIIYRPEGDYSTINEKVVERDTRVVYVQLKKYDEETWYSSSVSTDLESATQINVLATSTTYPTYPTITEAGLETTLTLSSPVSSTTSDLTSTITTTLQNYIDINKFDYNHNDKIGLKGQAYYPFTQNYTRYVNMLSPNVSVATGSSPYPSYPNFTNAGDPDPYPVKDIGSNWAHSQIYFPVNWSVVSSALQQHILTNVNTIFAGEDNQNNAYVRYQFSAYDSTLLANVYHSVIAYVSYQKDYTEERELRNSFSTWVTITKEVVPSNTDELLYTFTFNKDKNWFELDVRDYFYDYNQEPSIDVKVTFPLNPDYELITKNKFGVFFGSEDRLFLAGHPDYPNIDRYNVSNDLLGDNVKKQSYELSYFPSQNYRVLGGKGAINGYVVATDTQLYITKEEYPNDSKLFIRERTLNEQGLAGYNEFKTNVNETPLNERCIVRFYNDILILSKNGLYGVEISSNVLTNERLLKLRSGYINKHLKDVIAQESNDNIYIVENNQMMYIFVGKDVYVADSRYISKNENSEIENLSYEIIRWTLPEYYSIAKFDNNVLYAIADNSSVKLKLVDDTDVDFVSDFHESLLARSVAGILEDPQTIIYDDNWTYFADNDISDYVYENFDKSTFYTTQSNSISEVIAAEGIDFEFVLYDGVNDLITYSILNNTTRFSRISEGDTIYFIMPDQSRVGLVVDSIGEISFKVQATSAQNSSVGIVEYIGLDASKQNLYPVLAIKTSTGNYYKYSLAQHQEVFTYDLVTTPSLLSDVKAKLEELNQLYFILSTPVELKDVIISLREPIVFLWQSSMTDFGNNLLEKTMYRANIYATKLSTSNDLYFGYKTMRRYKSLEDTNTVKVLEYDVSTAIANQMDLNDLSFNLFSINTFDESGMSFPLKENNFLYIQFLVKASGRVELNAIEVIYKDNRRLKSIG